MHNDNTPITLFTQILGRPWAIDPRAALANVPLLAKVLDDHQLASAFFKKVNEDYNPDAEDKVEKLSKSYAGSIVNYPYAFYYPEEADKETEENSAAIIPFTGTMTKNGGLCAYGYNDRINWLKHADANPKISKIILLVDTPGGTVDGTAKTANVIQSLSKPSVAVVDGLCCSAGMWFSASADKIVALNETCEIGSIGVANYFADYRKFYEEMGVTFHDINSSYSPDKNKEYFDALAENYKTIQDESLDPLAKMFIANISRNRPSAAPYAEIWKTGKVFFASRALEIGLIDAIGSIETALDLLDDVPNKNSVQSKSFFIMNKKMPMLTAALGVDSLEATDEGVFLNEEQLSVIEASLADHQQKLTAEQEKITGLGAKIEELQSSVTAKEAVINTANTTIETLKEENTQLTTANSSLQSENDILKDKSADQGKGADADGDFGDTSVKVDPEAAAIAAARSKK